MAIELLKPLRDEEPLNIQFLDLLARSYAVRATVDGDLGDTSTGLDDNQQALEVSEKVLNILNNSGNDMEGQLPLDPTRHPLGRISLLANPGPLSVYCARDPLLLARGYTRQGVLLNRAGRNAEAAQVLQEAIAAYRELLEQNPRAGPFRHGLALALLHAGRIQTELGWPACAEPALREALERLQEVVRDEPFVPEYKATRLLAAGFLGETLYRCGRTGEAVNLLGEIDREGEDVLGGPHTSRQLRSQYVHLLHVLGCLQLETGDLDASLATCQKTREKLMQAIQEAPGDRSLRRDALGNREALARGRFLKRDLSGDARIAEQQQILAERKTLATTDVPARAFQGDAAGSAAVLAGLLLQADRPTER